MGIELGNPANEQSTKIAEKTRIPMSVPNQKLAVPDLPGYHCHWMLGTASRLAQAKRAGYTFVEDDEIDVMNFDIAGDPESSGNTDMGSKVSMVAGSDSAPGGDAVRLYLMKLPLELWELDQRKIADRQELTAAALRGDANIEQGYIPKTHQKSMAKIFERKT